VGEKPITTRIMSVSLPEPEEGGDTTVALPTDNAVEGNLGAMVASAEAQEFFLQGEEQGGGDVPGVLLDVDGDDAGTGGTDQEAPSGAPPGSGEPPATGEAPPSGGVEAEPAAP
jgi:hypothetical protein